MDTNFCNVSVPEVIVRLYSCQLVVFLACAPLCYHRGVGRGCGVGRGLGVALGVAVGMGVELGVTVGVAVAVAVGVGVTVGVGVGVGVPNGAQYLPPVFEKLMPSNPPQTIISLPVHTTV
jgi:hypothetical protein